MAKKKQEERSDLLGELLEHYSKGTTDNEQRQYRENGWDDVLKAYHNKLPEDWPFLSEVSDPLIRTTIEEKNARLFNGRLRGRLTPRKNTSVVKAKINNAILETQWDAANFGGTMLEKWALMDKQTRLFGASFALVYWRMDLKGEEVVFDGNEMKVLDNRDVIVDYTAKHTRDANWVQVREWKTLADLEEANRLANEPVYDLKALKEAMDTDKGDRRDSKYTSVTKELKGLEDRIGTDPAFPTFEIVTEYRCDRFVTFVPRLNVIIRDIPNPYEHGKIPVVQLRYYDTGDDIYGDSEVEPVMPLWRATNAFLCATLDEALLRQRPPIKKTNDPGIRGDTLVYGPNAIWEVGQSPNNVSEMQFSGDMIQNFQVIFSALKQAYNNAMGELSQGVGAADPFNPDKTATEVRASERQKLSRDQQNQMYLEIALKEMMMLWLSNNQQFLFDDPSRAHKVIKIVGREIIKDLQQYGLDSMEDSGEGIKMIAEIVRDFDGDISDAELSMMFNDVSVPRFPVIKNPDADPNDYQIASKMEVDEDGSSADIYLLREDLDGYYDYIPNVQSLAAASDEKKRDGRMQSLNLVLQPQIQQQLQLEGEKLQIKDLLVGVLEDNGITDAERFFEKLDAGGNSEAIPSPKGAGVDPAGGMAGVDAGLATGGQQAIPGSGGQEVPIQPV